jgi:hypothetical protein
VETYIRTKSYKKFIKFRRLFAGVSVPSKSTIHRLVSISNNRYLVNEYSTAYTKYSFGRNVG